MVASEEGFTMCLQQYKDKEHLRPLVKRIVNDSATIKKKQ